MIRWTCKFPRRMQLTQVEQYYEKKILSLQRCFICVYVDSCTFSIDSFCADKMSKLPFSNKTFLDRLGHSQIKSYSNLSECHLIMSSWLFQTASSCRIKFLTQSLLLIKEYSGPYVETYCNKDRYCLYWGLKLGPEAIKTRNLPR